MKSCNSCPSFTDDNARVNQTFGKAIGLPMCVRYGNILGAPDKTPEGDRQIRLWYGESCPSHGEAAPVTPEEVRVEISEKRLDTTPETNGHLQSCNSCAHFVTPQAANTSYNVTIGICAVKGKLVTSAVTEARDCAYAVAGTPHADTNSIRLLPQFAPGFKVDAHMQVQQMVSGIQVDPTTYDSDMPLSDEDVAQGIRAWRLVEDPDGEGKPAAIPIYGEGVFEDWLNELVPQTGGKGNPELYLDHQGGLYRFAVDSWNLDETLCLVGEPGTGKTELARFAAWSCRLPFQRFTFSASTETDDMVGKTMFDPDRGTWFQKGRITTFYEHPGIDLLDELNLARDECQQMLRPMMDNEKAFRLDQADGAEVSRGRGHRLWAAINPDWDFRNIGANAFAGADVSRMSYFELGFPPDAVVEEIVRRRCQLIGYEISNDTLSTILKVSEDFREASAQGTVPFTWQVREIVKVARKTKFYGLTQAFKSAVLDYVSPEARETAMTLIEGHLA